jgi:WD40 repeat protein
VTAATLDHTCRFLGVGSASGEGKVLNLKSGGTLYDLPKQDKEISCLKFLNDKCDFWLVGGCWGGRMVLYTKPTQMNNFTIHTKISISTGDIMALDNSKMFFVTGGTDCKLSVWNLHSGVRKFNFPMLDPHEASHHPKDAQNPRQNA